MLLWILTKITNWKVNVNLSLLSDHRAITYQLNMTKAEMDQVEFRTTRKYMTGKADWSQFRAVLRNRIIEAKLDHKDDVELTEQELEKQVQQYVEAIHTACEEAIPPAAQRKRKKNIWWNKDLEQKKKLTIRLRNRIKNARPDRRPAVIEEYMAARQDYKMSIQQAMTESWKKNCSEIKHEDVWKKALRIVKACSVSAHRDDKLLKSRSGTTLSPMESANLLAETFYPSDNPTEDTTEQGRLRLESERIRARLKGTASDSTLSFTHLELETVFRKMNPKKAPGGDGLTADICFEAYRTCPDALLGLYNRCLKIGVFPEQWKLATVRVIPKAGKEDYTSARSYRPIGLLPVLGKLLEKLFVNRLQWYLGSEQKLSPRQYGFSPQVSTEDALYDALSIIYEGLKSKKLVVVISLDIEGAFDNAWWPAVLTELADRGINSTLLRIICSYLEKRRISLKYAGVQVDKPTNKGCVQGSTCGPILWNVQMDALLQKAEELEVHIQAFADDILLIAQAHTGEELEKVINPALETIADWGRARKMKFAAHKTQSIIVTNKLKYESPKLQLNGTTLEFGEHLKVLGLTIDKNLNFLKHLDEVSKKSVGLYKLVTRAARAQWGLNSEIVRSIYSAVIEPTILYASSVWAHITPTVYARKRLDRITRMFAISISKAHSTTSLTAAAALARIIPLDLRARENRKLFEVKRGKPLKELPGRTLQKRISPFQLDHPARREKITFRSIELETDLDKIDNNYPNIFTDGSKIEGKVGGAISCWSDGREIKSAKFKLESYCSVYQAELYAILKALSIVEKGRQFSSANIISDSRSALESICDPGSLHPLVAKIKESMKIIKSNGGSTELYWIRAHRGIQGNERADELAKDAALRSKTASVYDAFPLSLAKHLTRAETLAEWEERYTTATTGHVTRRFFPTPQTAFKTLRLYHMNNLRAQALTGHGGFKAYLYKFNLARDPYCHCDGSTSETVEHILLECPRFSRERFECEMGMGLSLDETTIASAINDDHSREQFLRFLEKTVRTAARANGSTV